MVKFVADKVKKIDGISIWEYLKHDAIIKETELTNKDFGKFAEIIGKRITWHFRKSGILNDVFPNIHIISARRRYFGVGDIGYIVSYKENEENDEENQYKQKVVIFEIKHGKILIGKYQFEKYCRMLVDPNVYFPKADELKIVFMMFDNIDTKNKIANYSLKELGKDLAIKYLEEREKISKLPNVQVQIYDDLKILASAHIN